MVMPAHIGIIPDGNRRWALKNGMGKEEGYSFGLKPGIELFKSCKKLGIKELTFYGFTTDNTKRPALQTKAFTKACIEAVKMLSMENASLLVVGNADSPMFPKALLPYTVRKDFGKGGIKINFLVNYGWEWDLGKAKKLETTNRSSIMSSLNSKDITRVDLIIRWGGRRRLSGFLPVQSVYSDFYIINDYWPDFKPEHLMQALKWYSHQDVTLGG
ncbi:undecaprenyl diphosphate synthase family protein [Clostridium sp. WILCCON 0269]|uniref:Undecaprenyl diphosphate synthase family protein n=1 Tax=Candidatus Clostridium eludens TaxID=3381663 RepID=A0ABW8SFP5_9CLOT